MKIFNFIIITILLFLVISCQQKEPILIYNEIQNTVEVVNKNYSILALYINSKDSKGVEQEEAGLEFKKKDTIYKIGLDTIFLTKKILKDKNRPYEISALVRHLNKKDTIIIDEEKLKLLVLNSKEIGKGATDFKEFFK